MPLSLIGELILQPIAEVVLQLAGYFTAKIIIPIISFGKASVEPAPKGVRVTPKWHRFQRASAGTIVIEAEMASLLGLLFWLLVGIVTYFVRGTL